MVGSRVDQGGLYVLAGAQPASRVDQGGAYALAAVTPATRIDQSGAYAFIAVTAATGVRQAGAYVLANGGPCAGGLTQIWTIRRTDNVGYRFTSLDRNLAIGADIYKACNSLTPSASESIAELGQSGSMDLSGMLGEGGISELALHAGLFDGAYVEAKLVPWNGQGRIKSLLSGTFGAIRSTEEGFRAHLIGDGAKLEQTPLVRPLSPECQHQFGDRWCRKDLVPLAVTGTVESGSGHRTFTDALRAEAAGYFSRGRVTFLDGFNAGISAEIKLHSAGGVFELWPRLGFPIIPGTAYSLVPGCTNTKESAGGTNGCQAWGNRINYLGGHKVPGRDKRSAAANTRG